MEPEEEEEETEKEEEEEGKEKGSLLFLMKPFDQLVDRESSSSLRLARTVHTETK